MRARCSFAENLGVNAEAAIVTVTVEVGAVPPAAPRVPLATTGADLDVLMAIAVALVVAGVALVLLARTRLERSHA